MLITDMDSYANPEEIQIVDEEMAFDEFASYDESQIDDGSLSETSGTEQAPMLEESGNDPEFVYIESVTPDLGTADSDRLTSSAHLVVSGWGTPGAIFEVHVDQSVAALATVESDGSWTVPLPFALGHGDHFIEVLQNSDGYELQQDYTYVSVDLSTPEITLNVTETLDPMAIPIDIEINSLDRYPLSYFSIDVDFDGDGQFDSAGESDFYLDWASSGQTTIILSPYVEGALTLRARVADEAGNVGISETLTISIPAAATVEEDIWDDSFVDDGIWDDGVWEGDGGTDGTGSDGGSGTDGTGSDGGSGTDGTGSDDGSGTDGTGSDDGARNEESDVEDDTDLDGSSADGDGLSDSPPVGGEDLDDGALIDDDGATDEATIGDVDSPSGEDTSVDYSYSIYAVTPDLGASNSDRLTSAKQLAVSGEGTPNTSFEVYVDGLPAAQGTVDANGSWSVSLPPLTHGEHSFSVVRNVDGYQEYYDYTDVTVDLSKPVTTMNAPAFTNKENVPLTVEIASNDDYPLADLSIDFDLDGDGLFTSAGEKDFYRETAHLGPMEFSLPALQSGTYKLQARVSDWSGNTAVSELREITVDLEAGFIGSQPLRDLYHHYVSDSAGATSSSDTDGEDDPSTFDDPTLEFEAPEVPGDPMTEQDPVGDTDSTGGAGNSSVSAAPSTREDLEKILRIDAQNRVGVNVRAVSADGVEQLQADLEQLGMEVVWVEKSQYLITGYLPIDQIMALPSLKNFAAVTPLYQPILRAGSVPGQGDAPMKADVFRTDFGADGSGIKVGILSDSVDQVSGGISASQATGDLPTNVQVLQDFTGPPAPTDEGRAMLEIVHDVAPGASLAFHTAFISPQSFANGIVALASAGSQVIADDVGYLNEPFFNDGVISQAVDTVTASGSFYTSSAGNSADQGWLANWQGTNATIGSGGTAVTGTFFDFGGGDVLQDFTLPVGATAVISLQWDSAFLEGGSAAANFQVQNDLDVFVTDAAGTNIFATINSVNANTDEAAEVFAFTPTAAMGTTNFALAFRLTSGAAPNVVRWVSPRFDIQAQNQGAPTIFGHPVAKAAVAAAAAPWFSPTTAEPFTSLGGNMEILFDQQGNRLGSPEIRVKPEITAPDAVNTTFFGQDIPEDSDTLPNFFGTSAASPHVAGAAALLLSETTVIPAPADLLQHMEDTALDIDAPGFDFLTGAGLLQLERLPVVNLRPEIFDNDTSDKATNFGTFTGTMTRDDQSIARHANGFFDYDWFRFTAGTSGTFSVQLSNIETVSGGDLHMRLFVLQDGLLIEIASSELTGGNSEQTLSASVSAGQQLYLWVYGFGFEEGNYDITVTL